MQIDFSSVEAILFSVIGIVLIIGIIKLFKGMGNKMGIVSMEQPKSNFFRKIKSNLKSNKKVIIGITLLVSFSVLPLSVMATGVLTPSSGTAILNTPKSFSVTGLTADTYYTVYFSQGDSASTTLSVNKTSTSAGVLQFEITFTQSGGANVYVKDVTGATTQVSGSYIVKDYVNDLTPYLILFVTMSILFGVFAYIRREASFSH